MTAHPSPLRNPRFRRLVISRLTGSIGTGVMPIALAFGVLSLPGATPTSLSIVLALQAVPLVVMLPLGGVIADRFGRARVISYSDLTLSVVVGTVAVLFLTGAVTLPVLACLGLVIGALQGVWWPAYTGLTADVVKDDQLQRANAAVSVASNSGLVGGAAVAGLLVAAFGAGVAIAVEASTYLLAGLLVFTLRDASSPHDSGESMLGDLVHGWHVFTSFRWVVVVVGSFSVVLMALRAAEEVMGPVFAKEHYGDAGPAVWSLVLGSAWAGLLGAGLLGSRVRVRRPMLFGMLASFALPVWLLSLAFALPLWIVVPCAFAWGLAIELFSILWLTALQTNVPREALSRVGAYDAMGSLMFGPIGLALAGPLVTAAGLRAGFLIAAGITVVALLAGLLSPSVRNLRATRIT